MAMPTGQEVVVNWTAPAFGVVANLQRLSQLRWSNPDFDWQRQRREWKSAGDNIYRHKSRSDLNDGRLHDRDHPRSGLKWQPTASPPSPPAMLKNNQTIVLDSLPSSVVISSSPLTVYRDCRDQQPGEFPRGQLQRFRKLLDRQPVDRPDDGYFLGQRHADQHGKLHHNRGAGRLELLQRGRSRVRHILDPASRFQHPIANHHPCAVAECAVWQHFLAERDGLFRADSHILGFGAMHNRRRHNRSRLVHDHRDGAGKQHI